MEHLLVVLHTLADVREVGEDAGQQGLVVLGEAPVLALSPLHLLVDVDADTETNPRQQRELHGTYCLLTQCAMCTLGITLSFLLQGRATLAGQRPHPDDEATIRECHMVKYMQTRFAWENGHWFNANLLCDHSSLLL